MEQISTDPFVILLREFNVLIDKQPPLKEVKDSLLSIKERAINANVTGRQREAITERVDNYINGTYGRNLSTTK
jgi:hypothetical protein